MPTPYPSHYSLRFETELETFLIKGITEITIHLPEETDSITLNAHKLAIWNCTLVSDTPPIDLCFEIDPENQTVNIRLPKPIQGEIQVKINYFAMINDSLVGFYKSKYQVGEETRYLGVTQFEENYARQAFPCFDHPSKKAKFDIEFEIPANITAIANTPLLEEKMLENGKKLLQFQTTPIMASYLLFFGIGEFEIIEEQYQNTLHRIITTEGKTQYGQFGLKFSQKVQTFAEEYTGIKFPISKMDQIAVPDFAFGAMENYGAITYRENLLLVYPGITSAAGLERIAEVIAHEWSHQWFGNLVTPIDWKYLWLNESFATLFGYAISDHYYPEWDIWEQFLTIDTSQAFERDALIETIPIELPGEGDQIKINSATAPIIYNKGGSILQMIKGYLGEETFQKGIQTFLKKFAFKNAASTDYWQAFEKIIDEPISQIMESWIHHRGFPVVKVKRNGDNLQFSQNRFTYLTHTSDHHWSIPLTVETYSKDNDPLFSRVLMTEETLSFTLPPDTIAYKINVNQTGFYRVQYDPDSLEALGKLIHEKRISPKDRYGVLDDLNAFMIKGDVPLDYYLDFLKHFIGEMDYAPISGIMRGIMRIHDIIPAQQDKIKKLGKEILTPVLEKIGYSPQEEDKHITTILRSQLLWITYRLESPETIQFGEKMFSALKNGEKIPADLLAITMRLGAALHSDSYSWFIDKLENPKTMEMEKLYLLGAIGNFSDKNTLFKALQYCLDKVPPANKFIPIVYSIRNPIARNEMWKWYQKNLLELENIHSTHHERLIEALIPVEGLGYEKEIIGFFESYAKSHPIAKDTIDMALEKLQINIQIVDNNS